MAGLIAYKGGYGELVGTEGAKFVIRFAGQTIKVRAKDFRLLHPEFETPRDNLTPDVAVFVDLAGERLSITELSEWVFNEYTPSSAWHTYLLATDGLYCYFNGDDVVVRPVEQREKIAQQRAEEAAESERLTTFAKHYHQGEYSQLDAEIIAQITKVAYAQLKTHKIFKVLDIAPSPENALRLLHTTGALSVYANPYPERAHILTDETCEWQKDNDERADLTHLTSYAIDNAHSNDADDAISIDGERIWVHIADIGSAVNDELLAYASKRISNLYLPNTIYHMLPEELVEQLSLSKTVGALSIGFILSDEGDLKDIQILKSTIKVNTLSYDEAEALLTSDLADFYRIYQQHLVYRTKRGAFSVNIPQVDVRVVDEKVVITTQRENQAREMVAEFMVLAGRAVAEFAQQNDIALPFISQKENSISEEIKVKELSLAEKFAVVKQFPRSSTSITARAHHGMGLESYVRVTSPMRRFLDFLTHLQLHYFIHNKPLLSSEQLKKYIGNNNIQLATINRCVRSSELYYKLLYLQNNNKKYNAIVISNYKQTSLVFILEVALIGEVNQKLSLDNEVSIKVKNIDIYTLSFELILV